LENLEFGSDSDTKAEAENLSISIPPPVYKLEAIYQLPTLPKPLSLYSEYVLYLDNLNNKILDTLSSSPYKEYIVIIKATKNYLILGSLQELDTQNTRKAQVNRYKAKLNIRLSFQKGE
jgi:hypothetical protein